MSSTDLAVIEQSGELATGQPVLWINKNRNASGAPGEIWNGNLIGRNVMLDAAARFGRFRGVLKSLFHELQATNGVIESELRLTKKLQDALGLNEKYGKLFVKADHSLPIAGSIKARGGIHEVLKFAEDIGLKYGIITGDDRSNLLTPSSKELLGKYKIAVGSTGNLGLSIGVIASALGFQATVHMSADAKEWKKNRLRNRGVTVIEHEGDYAAAVEAGRQESSADPFCHFVDDESSLALFAGYSAAALGLKQQLTEQSVIVDKEHPLFVYIPCGVGGAPGGIAFGLAHTFGANVHCFFAEPVASPCFLVALNSPPGKFLSVYDAGLNNRTEADGLAVPRASEYAVSVMAPVISGVFTVQDNTLFRHLHTAEITEGLRIEPSAAAGFDGPDWLTNSVEGHDYISQYNLKSHLHQSTHILWTTGGLFVPEEEYAKFNRRGRNLNEN